MMHLAGNKQAYRVEPDIDPVQWKRGQEYDVHEVIDCRGDSIWSVTGPDLDLFTYSWDHVRSLLHDRGVDIRFTRRSYVPPQ